MPDSDPVQDNPRDTPNLPAVVKEISKLPPENFPTFDPAKPDTDYQLQQALTVLRAMPPMKRASR